MNIEQRRTIAACYCRLSDDDAQDGTSVSIETQTKILGDYCRNHDFEIYDYYKDMKIANAIQLIIYLFCAREGEGLPMRG